jgi:glycosyltransferase involved in cell wall biosynthesis
MENTCLNHYLSLPNKFFEYLAAGVPVIIPDFPEMRRVIESRQCGWVWSDRAENLANIVQSLSRDAVEGKKRRASIAGQELTWEREEQGLLNLYHQLLN